MKRTTFLLTTVSLFFVFLTCCAQIEQRSQSASPESYSESYLDVGTYGMKIYFVNYAFYPHVMVYFRTLDANREPLMNVTPFNVGLMVQGRAYDPYRKQYYIETLRTRTEGCRTCIVVDCSKSMAGRPFADALDACRSYIRLKTPADEIGIIALTDEVINVCHFTKDGARAELFLKDLHPTGERTLLFDGVARAMQACGTAGATSFGGTTGETGYVVLSNIVVISDGVDEGSIITKDNLISKISTMDPPIPIYSLVYSKSPRHKTGALEALSVVSFGRSWTVSSSSAFTRVCNKIQAINRHDYVLTFRSYLPVDGKKHNLKVLLNYEGRAHFDDAYFEAVEVPAFNDAIRRAKMALERRMPPLPDENPYVGPKQPGAERYGIQPPTAQ